MQNAEKRLRIALQKSGRLSDDSLSLLRQCGIKVQLRSHRLLCHCENAPIDLLFVRDDDIPGLVLDKICDMGIVGTNVLQEKLGTVQANNNTIEVTTELNFGACRLAIAVPDAFQYNGLESLNGIHIATSYPHLLQHFLTQHDINATVTTLSGSVEIAPRCGIADAICDLVSTGATLEANGLREVAEVFCSQAVLIHNKIAMTTEKKAIATWLQRRLTGVLQASESKYIMLHAPRERVEQITRLLPGAEHPTIMPLDGDAADGGGKLVVHAVCRETIFWETMEELQALGASSILVLPVEKMLA